MPYNDYVILFRKVVRMAGLEKRLEIRLDKARFLRLQGLARQRKRRIAAIVREAIDDKLDRASVEERLAAIESMGRINAPVADWEQMEREIESGYD